MNWAKALGRIDTLNKGEIVGLQTVLRHAVAGYKRAIKNYPPGRMKKYGLPYLNRLENALEEVDQKLA